MFAALLIEMSKECLKIADHKEFVSQHFQVPSFEIGCQLKKEPSDFLSRLLSKL